MPAVIRIDLGQVFSPTPRLASLHTIASTCDSLTSIPERRRAGGGRRHSRCARGLGQIFRKIVVGDAHAPVELGATLPVARSPPRRYSTRRPCTRDCVEAQRRAHRHRVHRCADAAHFDRLEAGAWIAPMRLQREIEATLPIASSPFQRLGLKRAKRRHGRRNRLHAAAARGTAGRPRARVPTNRRAF